MFWQSRQQGEGFGRKNEFRVRPQLLELESRLTPADIIVATTGSDSAGSGSLSAPFATLGKGVAAADPGDRVLLRGGTYSGGVTVSEPEITIESYPGEWAVVSSPADNSSVSQTIRFHVGADRCVLRRVEVVGGYYYCVKTETTQDDGRGDAATHLLIEDSKLHDSGRDVIKLVPGTDDVTVRRCEIYNSGRRDASNAEGIDNVNGDRMTVQDCYIHNIATNGVYPKGGTIGSVVERNLIAECGHAGVAVGYYTDAEFFDTAANPGYYEAIDAVVRNNVIVGTGYAGVGFYASKGARVFNNTLVDVARSAQAGVVFSNVDHYVGGQFVYQRNVDPWLVNNIVVMTNSRPAVEVRADSLTGAATFGNNRYHRSGGAVGFRDLQSNGSSGTVTIGVWQGWGYDSGSGEADPLLDQSYHLRSGSPAVNAGRPVSGLGVDYDGNMRLGLPDVGADEFGAGPSLQTPPPGGVVGTGALPAVESVIVNRGEPQRSRVTEISVTFDTEVDPSLLAGAFTLTRVSDGARVGTVVVATGLTEGRRTVSRLTFSGANTTAGSLDDGRWVLSVDRTRVRLATGVQMASDFAWQTHRLFGDGDGDLDVDNGDLLRYRVAHGSIAGQAGYAADFDYDGDGDVDGSDLFQFRFRFGKQL